MTRILFICMGNICRSPIVEAVARAEFARSGVVAEVASAGTEAYHVGECADPRAIRIAAGRGYALAAHRARQVDRADFATFDHVLAMDRVNLRALQRFRPAQDSCVPALFLGEDEVPDPYYGSDADFEQTIALAQRGVAALIDRLRIRPCAATSGA